MYHLCDTKNSTLLQVATRWMLWPHSSWTPLVWSEYPLLPPPSIDIEVYLQQLMCGSVGDKFVLTLYNYWVFRNLLESAMQLSLLSCVHNYNPWHYYYFMLVWRLQVSEAPSPAWLVVANALCSIVEFSIQKDVQGLLGSLENNYFSVSLPLFVRCTGITASQPI